MNSKTLLECLGAAAVLLFTGCAGPYFEPHYGSTSSTSSFWLMNELGRQSLEKQMFQDCKTMKGMPMGRGWR